MRLLRTAFRAKHIAISALLLVALCIVGLMNFDLRPHILSFLVWMEKQGIWAPVLFIIIDAVIVVLLLPGLVLTLGAGFMFGVIKGGIYVITGTTIGSLLAFLVARRLKGTKYSQYFLQNQRLQLLGSVFKRRGWGTVLVTRLVPFFPFKLSNYFFGLSGYSLIDFLIGTFLGIMPITFCNTYLGSLAADLTMIGSERVTRSPVEWLFYGLGFVTLLGIFIIATRIAQQKLKQNLREETRGQNKQHN